MTRPSTAASASSSSSARCTRKTGRPEPTRPQQGADTGAKAAANPGPQPGRLHHTRMQDPGAFGSMESVDPPAAAVGIVGCKIIMALGQSISADAARCIYASILADTGFCRYSSSDPECRRVAAELLEAGVDPWEMTVRVFEQQPLARMRLLAEVLETLEVHGKLATITITNEMVTRTGRGDDPTDGFINHAPSVACV